MNESFSQRYRCPAVIFAFFFPFVLTWCYLILGARLDPDIQKGIYGAGKIVQFLFPVFWIYILARICRKRTIQKKSSSETEVEIKKCDSNQAEPLEPLEVHDAADSISENNRKFSIRLLIEGSLFGMAVLGLMLFAFYHLDFLSDGLARLKEELVPRLSRMGVAQPVPYIILGVFYCVIHSGLEEYYWRWFVFGELKEMKSVFAAVLLSAIGFTLHHIILLGTYFGFTSFLCWFCSFGVFTGGVYWAWLYRRAGKIYAPWLSHAFIDLAIFIIGYKIIFH